ncbi:MAG: hypothetical protein ACOYOF_07210 [Verrucomicrobiaceae bacterium]|jgi:hypothetical protein
MTLSDVAELTHLGWESVKNITKADPGRGCASIPMKEVTMAYYLKKEVRTFWV